jgi:hypothetical protein
MQSRQRYYHAFNILPFHTGSQLVFLLLEPQNLFPDMPWLYPMNSSCTDNIRFSSYSEKFKYCAASAEF